MIALRLSWERSFLGPVLAHRESLTSGYKVVLSAKRRNGSHGECQSARCNDVSGIGWSAEVTGARQYRVRTSQLGLFQTRYYSEAFDLVVEIGLQENIIIFKGHAAI